jgi:hypothetical protein
MITGLTGDFRSGTFNLRRSLSDACEGPFDYAAMVAQPCVFAWVGFFMRLYV